MKVTAFALTKEEAAAALLKYAEDNGHDVDVDKEWIIIQQDDGTVDCSRGEE